jgi:hypothetical protein
MLKHTRGLTAAGAFACSACWGSTVGELPEVRTPLAWTNDCPAADPLGGFTVQEPDLDECSALATQASPSGDIRCWITFDASGAAIVVRCPSNAETKTRLCLEKNLKETVVVPYTDCSGKKIEFTTDVGLFWSGEGSRTTSLPRYSRIEIVVE